MGVPVTLGLTSFQDPPLSEVTVGAVITCTSAVVVASQLKEVNVMTNVNQFIRPGNGRIFRRDTVVNPRPSFVSLIQCEGSMESCLKRNRVNLEKASEGMQYRTSNRPSNASG